MNVDLRNKDHEQKSPRFAVTPIINIEFDDPKNLSYVKTKDSNENNSVLNTPRKSTRNSARL